MIYDPKGVLKDLHPVNAEAFRETAAYLYNAFRAGQTKSLFHPFQAFRSPDQQAELLRRFPPVTAAGPWESAHNYGLAVDFVASHKPGVTPSGLHWDWSPEHDWSFIKKAAGQFGLIVPIKWDLGHVESPIFVMLKGFLDRNKPRAP